MSLIIVSEDLQIIQNSSLSENDKRDLSSSLNQTLLWTKVEKEEYYQAVTEWDKNHAKGPRPDGKPFLTPFRQKVN